MKNDFTMKHTNYCKGIAIILMVIHHLFWNKPYIGMMIGDISLSQRVGIIGKVCVSIFLVLSGLGLFKSTREIHSIKEFYCTKLYRLYMNYFFIVSTSIVISLIFFRNQFLSIVGDGFKGICRLTLNFTGLQYVVGYQGFNGAWWFMSVILSCYLIFPFIKIVIEKYGLKVVLIFFILSCFDMVSLGPIKIFTIISWMFPFVLGVYIAFSNILFKIKNWIYKDHLHLKKIILFNILFLSLFLRQELEPQGFFGIKFDYYLACIIILSVYIFFEDIAISTRVICFFGEKSMDIYYIHMFITTYYLSDLIYSINNVFFMIVAVIILSLIWSYALNIIRKITSWDKLIMIGSKKN